MLPAPADVVKALPSSILYFTEFRNEAASVESGFVIFMRYCVA